MNEKLNFLPNWQLLYCPHDTELRAAMLELPGLILFFIRGPVQALSRCSATLRSQYVMISINNLDTYITYIFYITFNQKKRKYWFHTVQISPAFQMFPM